MCRIVIFLIFHVLMSKMSPKTLKKLQADLLETENNHQEVRLKLSVCMFSFGPQMDPCGPQKMICDILVLGCDPKLTICGPQILTLALSFTVLLITFSSDICFASNLCRFSLFSMDFHLIQKNNIF
jgi:hypothetical protein